MTDMRAADAPEIRWECLLFAALDGARLHKIHRARQEVFVVEQKCAYQDADGYDPVSHHLTGWRPGADGDEQVAAYLRLIPPGLKYAEPALGRILTTSSGRGRGFGKELMRQGLAAAERLYPGQGVRISAQHYLERFYQGFGFATVSSIYDEDGIPHIEMLYPTATKVHT